MVQSAGTDSVFHALSNSTWRRVLEQRSAGPATVGELAAPVDMKLPSFVQHLSVLEQCRLVKSHRDEADLETNKASGFYESTEIALDQFVAHVISMK